MITSAEAARAVQAHLDAGDRDLVVLAVELSDDGTYFDVTAADRGAVNPLDGILLNDRDLRVDARTGTVYEVSVFSDV
jgi:hypothetical protein